jgi:hypothetical protein
LPGVFLELLVLVVLLVLELVAQELWGLRIVLGSVEVEVFAHKRDLNDCVDRTHPHEPLFGRDDDRHLILVVLKLARSEIKFR